MGCIHDTDLAMIREMTLFIEIVVALEQIKMSLGNWSAVYPSKIGETQGHDRHNRTNMTGKA